MSGTFALQIMGQTMTFDIRTVTAIAAYSAASSLMLVVNKVVMAAIPLHSLVTVIQLVFCSLFVLGVKYFKLSDIDDFEWSKVKPYLLYIGGFCFGIYANMRALATANVETVIVFRATCPLAVAGLDMMFLGREAPAPKSIGALVLIVVGALGYCSSDKDFESQGWGAYTWVTLYTLAMCFQMTYGKYILSEVKMKSRVWGAVMYTNVLGILPEWFLGFVIFDEATKWVEHPMAAWPSGAWGALLLSCILGTAIAYAGFNCRNVLSATSFTVVGVLNKMITVLINVLIWDNHANATGIMWLALCIAAGTIYREAPLRTKKEEPKSEQPDVEMGKLLGQADDAFSTPRTGH